MFPFQYWWIAKVFITASNWLCTKLASQHMALAGGDLSRPRVVLRPHCARGLDVTLNLITNCCNMHSVPPVSYGGQCVSTSSKCVTQYTRTATFCRIEYTYTSIRVCWQTDDYDSAESAMSRLFCDSNIWKYAGGGASPPVGSAYRARVNRGQGYTSHTRPPWSLCRYTSTTMLYKQCIRIL